MYDEQQIIKDWKDIDLSFGLIYPNIYKIGMSSYSIRLLYYLINSIENVACERIFLPDHIRFPASDDTSSLNRIRSIETKRIPKVFDVLGFSVQYENDYRNVLWILEKSNIPLRSKERNIFENENQSHFPLIVGGGPVITSNPIPFSKIFDILFIGDSELNLKKFLEKFIEFKKKSDDVNEFVQNVISLDGIFIPSIRNSVKRNILKDLNLSPTPNYQLISPSSKKNKIFENVYFIEVNRGCPYQCKFCISSFHNSPFRIRSFENIKTAINDGVKYTQFETIGLIGPCVSAHPNFKEICELIINSGKKLKVPSIRIEHLNEGILHVISKGGIKTITIAPESGSERLRFNLGKKITDKVIFSIIEKIKKSSIKNIKLYFLIGLPNESEHEITETIEFIKKITQIGFDTHTLRININPLIPKLNTPYEKELKSYLSHNLGSLRSKMKRIHKELNKYPSVKLKFQNPKEIIKQARLQTLVSVGNLEVADLLLQYYNFGANFGSLRRAKKELRFSEDEYYMKIINCYSPWKI
jgi:radical SAM superfamily enzyme YgiQ (UPF0313 family)